MDNVVVVDLVHSALLVHHDIKKLVLNDQFVLVCARRVLHTQQLQAQVNEKTLPTSAGMVAVTRTVTEIVAR
jgi:hypothetical protein